MSSSSFANNLIGSDLSILVEEYLSGDKKYWKEVFENVLDNINGVAPCKFCSHINSNEVCDICIDFMKSTCHVCIECCTVMDDNELCLCDFNNLEEIPTDILIRVMSEEIIIKLYHETIDNYLMASM